MNFTDRDPYITGLNFFSRAVKIIIWSQNNSRLIFAQIIFEYLNVVNIRNKFSIFVIPDAPRRRRRSSLLGGEQSADTVPRNVDPPVRPDHYRPRTVPAQVHARQDTFPIRAYYRRTHLDVLRSAVYN